MKKNHLLASAFIGFAAIAACFSCGGIIIDGKILTGSTGAGGEIGHIHVEDSEKEACGCGNKGCLEQVLLTP